jgi:hypothetical protein
VSCPGRREILSNLVFLNRDEALEAARLRG